MSWFLTTYFEVRGTRLFEDVYVRTSSLDFDGYSVTFGNFDAEGLNIGNWQDEDSNNRLGLSVGRSF